MLSTPQSMWYKAFNLAEGDANNVYDWPNKAQVKLGLTDQEANYLFDSAYGNRRQQFETVKKRVGFIRLARKRGVSLYSVTPDDEGED